jgi:hypothetical protein
VRWSHLLSTREDRPEVRFGKDASDFFAFVALDFDLAIFDRAANSTSLLHRASQALFLRQTNPDESSHHRDSFAAAPGLLSDDIDPPATLARRRFPSFLLRVRRCFRARWQMVAGQDKANLGWFKAPPPKTNLNVFSLLNTLQSSNLHPPTLKNLNLLRRVEGPRSEPLGPKKGNNMNTNATTKSQEAKDWEFTGPNLTTLSSPFNQFSSSNLFNASLPCAIHVSPPRPTPPNST